MTYHPVNFGKIIDVTKLLEHRQFINVSLFQKIVDTFNPRYTDCTDRLLNFILDSFPQIYRKLKIFSERKLLILLAHKYGDESSYFNTLPKELIRIIIDYLDEPPVAHQFVEILLQYERYSVINRHVYFVNLCTNYLDRIRLHYTWIRRIYFKLEEVPAESLPYLKHTQVMHNFVLQNEKDPAYFANYHKLDHVRSYSYRDEYYEDWED